MTIKQEHVGEDVPYGEIRLAVETADLWLLEFEQRAMVLLKQDLTGDIGAFRAFLRGKVRCVEL